MADNKKNKGLLLIDPNDAVSTLPESFNGSPEYEKMFIFAELTAKRRGRSVIVSRGGKTRGAETLTNINIGLMGSDQSDPNNVQDTTKWTENITGSKTIYEGFGIDHIKVVTNSSFIPQVTIEFIDIRGLTFFNLGKNSPYSVLFDFPPPLFNLTLKGYYGRSLTYELHLVRTNTRFEAEKGNFYITVDFIARTFAPLTDIPFKYVSLLPLTVKDTNNIKGSADPEGRQKTDNPSNSTTDPTKLNPSSTNPPKNTYELTMKLKNLYREVNNVIDTSEESKDIVDAKLGLIDAKLLLSNITDFKKFMDNTLKEKSKILINTPSSVYPDSGGEVREITNLIKYNEVLLSKKSTTNNNDFKHRLFLAVKTSTDDNEKNALDTIPSEETKIKNSLNGRIKNILISGALNLFNLNEKDIVDASKVIKFIDFPKRNNVTYLGIDITSYYIKLREYINEKNRELFDLNSLRDNKINEIVVDNLGGMKPTIYNIFEIICNDIDKFFNILRKTSINSIDHHETNSNLIIDAVKETRVGAFPLYIKEQVSCNTKTQTRAIPTDLSDRVENAGGGRFPELILVDDFINAFITFEKEELVNDPRTQIDEIGNNKWIPISPTDSSLILDNYESPYSDLEYQYQNIDNDKMIEKIYNKIIERFYIASQYTYDRDFYLNNSSVFPKENALVKMIANGEATNLANSLINKDVINTLIVISKKYNKKSIVGNFFTEITNIGAFDTVNDNFLVLDNATKTLYNDPTAFEYIGIKILNNNVDLRTKTSDSTSKDIIDQFLNDDTFTWDSVLEFFGLGFGNNIVKQFTKENIIYFPDADPKDSYYTSYLTEIVGISDRRTVEFTIPNKTTKTTSYLDLWGGYLRVKNKELLTLLKKTETNDIETTALFGAQAFWIAANFGGTRSFFGDHGGGLKNATINEKFMIPSVLEVPFFATIYMGGLVKYNDPTEYEFRLKVNEIYNTMIAHDISSDAIKGVLTGDTVNIGDIETIKKLSERDSFEFVRIFNIFSKEDNSGSDGFLKVKTHLIDLLENNTDKTKVEYINLLKDSAYKQSIIDHLNKKYSVVNFNQFTFDLNYSATTYSTLKELNTDSIKQEINEIYFLEFFKNLKQLLVDRLEKLKNIEANLNESIDDSDIKTQMYYSFKNISDKWISGFGDSMIGFPLNKNTEDKLINKFAFVDRAMNPIGDRMVINAESLLNTIEDYDVSVFTVISRLLSLNGLEFFPLQNLMAFNNFEWKESFKLSNTVELDVIPAFVCMYIGGTSTTLNNPNSYFDDDGIIDLEGDDLTDFGSNECTDEPPIEVVNGNENFPYSQVRAFKVGFAEQNQSMFTDIELDSREYPETNESLAILSLISHDESKSSPIPKGQNLFSMYEVRSYSAKITSLGNMMIQPTQYFQLENIPMFSGAYVILEVEHNVSPNHMLTKFSGVRILKYPNPIVTEFLTSVGIQPSSLGISPYINETINESINRIKDSPIYEKALRSGIIKALATPPIFDTGDKVTNDNIKKLHPFTKPKAIKLVTQFNEKDVYKKDGIKLRITSTFRSFEEQNILYNKGRTTFGKKVTNAIGGRSYHNYGLAFDVVPYNSRTGEEILGLDDNTGDFIDDNAKKRWEDIGKMGKDLGLNWGGNFTSIIDYPHLEDRYDTSVDTYLSAVNKGDSITYYPIIIP